MSKPIIGVKEFNEMLDDMKKSPYGIAMTKALYSDGILYSNFIMLIVSWISNIGVIFLSSLNFLAGYFLAITSIIPLVINILPKFSFYSSLARFKKPKRIKYMTYILIIIVTIGILMLGGILLRIFEAINISVCLQHLILTACVTIVFLGQCINLYLWNYVSIDTPDIKRTKKENK